MIFIFIDGVNGIEARSHFDLLARQIDFGSLRFPVDGCRLHRNRFVFLQLRRSFSLSLFQNYLRQLPSQPISNSFKWKGLKGLFSSEAKYLYPQQRSVGANSDRRIGHPLLFQLLHQRLRWCLHFFTLRNMAIFLSVYNIGWWFGIGISGLSYLQIMYTNLNALITFCSFRGPRCPSISLPPIGGFFHLFSSTSLLRVVSHNVPNFALQIWTFLGQIFLFRARFAHCKTHRDKAFCRSYQRSTHLVAAASERKTRISFV